VKSHDKFCHEIQAAFTLLSDEDKQIVEAYGSGGEGIHGTQVPRVYRVTFLIGPDGRIRRIWPSVKPEEHAEEVLAALQDGFSGA